MKKIFDLIFIYILKAIFFIISKFHVVGTKRTKGILVLSYFNLGDLICDTPSLRALRVKYIDYKIICLVRSVPHKELMDKCPYIDEAIIIYSEKKNSLLFYIKQLIILFNENIFASFQLVRHYGQLRRSAIPYILGIKYRYGLLNKNRPEFNKCYSNPIITNNYRSRTDESLLVVESADIEIVNRETFCWFDNEDIKTLSKKVNFFKDKYTIIIHLGGTDPMKCWNIINYVTVAKKLHNKYDCQFILTGVYDEHEKICLFIKYANLNNVIDLCDKLNIFELFALISKSDLVITNDTGPMHFSIALKKNTVAIFGPTPPSYAIGNTDRPFLKVVRGETSCVNQNLCDIYNNIGKKSNTINSICESKYMVCVDKVSTDQVYKQCVSLMENL
ncbi:MAG: glycosyltransferase family 9 protein [Oscillospiraceae bacterium]|nr:glycosyltransferase family 9 protein [Oscillospiraceae bacterium]